MMIIITITTREDGSRLNPVQGRSQLTSPLRTQFKTINLYARISSSSRIVILLRSTCSDAQNFQDDDRHVIFVSLLSLITATHRVHRRSGRKRRAMSARGWVFAAALMLSLWDTILADRASKCSQDPKCRVVRVHSMKSADCFKLDARRIPRCLSGDIEVMDLTFNRIREISATDLERYTNLKFLYLGENMITKIDPEAFTGKTELQTLDLSYNGFSKPLPDVIFRLPSLQNLYLSQNQNINIIEILENAAPIRSPLVKLDISYNNYEDVHRLPNLGIIATMVMYNVSGMDLVLSPMDTAGLCNLKFFINDNVTAYFDDPCDCWSIQRWFEYRNVKFTPFTCLTQESECSYEIPDEAEEMHSVCKQQHAEKIYQDKLNHGLLIGGISIGVILLVLVIVIYKWRRMSHRKRQLRHAFMQHDLDRVRG